MAVEYVEQAYLKEIEDAADLLLHNRNALIRVLQNYDAFVKERAGVRGAFPFWCYGQRQSCTDPRIDRMVEGEAR